MAAGTLEATMEMTEAPPYPGEQAFTDDRARFTDRQAYYASAAKATRTRRDQSLAAAGLENDPAGKNALAQWEQAVLLADQLWALAATDLQRFLMPTLHVPAPLEKRRGVVPPAQEGHMGHGPQRPPEAATQQPGQKQGLGSTATQAAADRATEQAAATQQPGQPQGLGSTAAAQAAADRATEQATQDRLRQLARDKADWAAAKCKGHPPHGPMRTRTPRPLAEKPRIWLRPWWPASARKKTGNAMFKAGPAPKVAVEAPPALPALQGRSAEKMDLERRARARARVKANLRSRT